MLQLSCLGFMNDYQGDGYKNGRNLQATGMFVKAFYRAFGFRRNGAQKGYKGETGKLETGGGAKSNIQEVEASLGDMQTSLEKGRKRLVNHIQQGSYVKTEMLDLNVLYL